MGGGGLFDPDAGRVYEVKPVVPAMQALQNSLEELRTGVNASAPRLETAIRGMSARAARGAIASFAGLPGRRKPPTTQTMVNGATISQRVAYYKDLTISGTVTGIAGGCVIIVENILTTANSSILESSR